MAGSNAITIKRALIDYLGRAPRLQGVQIAYAFPGRTLARECIYAGGVRCEQQLVPIDRPTVRRPRAETATLTLVIQVRIPGGTLAETDARADELLTVIDELFADDVTLGGTVGSLAYGGVTAGELTYAPDDDAAVSRLTITVVFHSMYIL